MEALSKEKVMLHRVAERVGPQRSRRLLISRVQGKQPCTSASCQSRKGARREYESCEEDNIDVLCAIVELRLWIFAPRAS